MDRFSYVRIYTALQDSTVIKLYDAKVSMVDEIAILQVRDMRYVEDMLEGLNAPKRSNTGKL